ncbi:hypothetical protein C5Y96_12605 [Blastopirellula marina]|uniref:Uncharacterized protein n=1 Tax=Blastopirellula marina TaxID=124 RepID=A0A2S8FGY9_9BACT|nr:MULTISPECIES: hypothetical protein [Pirellulaceae]PQO31184.1 hypothetical protein C5Y96_12605 [Blastopirellula marina]RCS51578.1 hypothetical protein DTL36_12615 [Bremerella cremea]
MRCGDILAFLTVFTVLIGCGQPPNSQKLSSQLPLVGVHSAKDDADEVIYHWEHNGEDAPCLIPLPNRSSRPVMLRFRQMKVEGDRVGLLFLDSDFEIEVGKIVSDQFMIFVRPGEVIPYHDQLYQVVFDDTSLDIKRVTASIPESYHPHPQYLVVPRAESPTVRQRLYILKRDSWSDYERVRVTHIAVDGSHAEYVGKPYYGSSLGEVGDKRIEPFEVVHQWANSTTDVAGIVPPIDIEGVGRLRGWVEFRQTISDN